jgi:RHS repeat-associated protein
MNIQNTLTRALIATVALFVGTQAFAARTTTYYHTDALGSVVAATNEAGAVLWRKDYAPFGEQIDATPDTEKLSYTGKSHDDATGLANFGARNFDPEIGRFLSVDPVGFVEDNPMSFNRYLYVNNNPYKYVDPDGEFLNFALKFVLDVGVNIAFNYATSGSLGVGTALKESALGVFNPTKTLAKGKQLADVWIKTKKAGRLGNEKTRTHVEDVANTMEKRGWKIEKGGGRGPEEYLRGAGGGTKGSSYPDITATKNGKTLRVNTVDTRADGITMTTREANNANRIRAQTGGHVLTVPKSK